MLNATQRIGPSSKSSLLTAAVCALSIGCVTERHTEPARTATEQLLISTAADRAANLLDLAGAAGESGAKGDPSPLKAAMVTERFEAYDKGYALSVLADRLQRLGVDLVPEEQAEILIEVRSGALSIDRKARLLGIPSIKLPVPFASDVLETPELALFKHDVERGVAKFAWTVRRKEGGEWLASSGPAVGQAHVTRWVILFVGYTTSDARPEERKMADLVAER